MNCGEMKLQISAHLDGALSGSESRHLLDHVGQCESCRDFLLEQQRVLARLQAPDLELELPARLWDRIHAEISPARIVVGRFPRSRWFSVERLGYALAASLALAVLSGSLFLGFEGSDQQLLAQLDAYQVDVPDNPFLVEEEVDNPFFEPLNEVEGNPFDQMRSQR